MVAPVLDWTAMGVASKKYFGVSGIPTQLLVLHSAECPLAPGYAQSLSKWACGTVYPAGPIASWHRFVGPDVRLRLVPDHLGAWHASEANVLSIGWEQAGYAAYRRDQWLSVDGQKQIDNLAYDMAEVAIRDGIPARWLSTAEVRAILDSGNRQIKGFCTHRQIDPESRTDPGDGYPYDLLMAKIKQYVVKLTATKVEEIVATVGEIATGVWHTNIQQLNQNGTPLSVQKAHYILGNMSQCFSRVLADTDDIQRKQAEIKAQLGSVQAALADLGTAAAADVKHHSNTHAKLNAQATEIAALKAMLAEVLAAVQPAAAEPPAE